MGDIFRLDGNNVNELSPSSKKIIYYYCSNCGKYREKKYISYCKNHITLCENCLRKYVHGQQKVKDKKSLASKLNWKKKEYRETITKKISEARKNEWAKGTRKCSNKTPYKIVKELINSNGYILNTLEDDYNKKGRYIYITCPFGHTFKTFYVKFKGGCRCLQCRKVNFANIANSFTSENYILHTTQNEYINNQHLLEYTCPKGNKHHISWSNWILGHRCPCCNTGISQAENEISNFLISINQKIEKRNRNIIKPLELDIIIPDKKIAIEYCGLHYHSETKLGKKYHLEKLTKTNSNGYRLITIFEDEWLTKQEIVKDRLKYILGQSSISIGARKCTIREITNGEAKKFIDKYHIQGYTNCKIKLGAFYDTKLVSVMTFAKSSIAKGSKHHESVWELSRFCLSMPIIGIAGKLLSYFKNHYDWNKIYTYADLRWSEGTLYKKLGFQLHSISKPNYWYFKDPKKRIHRFNFRKDKIKHLGSGTEWEIMQSLGYNRIWDCGNKKYVMNKI